LNLKGPVSFTATEDSRDARQRNHVHLAIPADEPRHTRCAYIFVESRSIAREAGSERRDARLPYTCGSHVTKGKAGKGKEKKGEREREREREREERVHLSLARVHRVDLRHSIMFSLHR